MNKIKAIFFDADDTLMDHHECERQALIYLFNHIGMNYKNEYQNIFSPLDCMLWDSISLNTCPVSVEEIPVYRFQRFFASIGVKYDDYVKANELFKKGLAKSTVLLKNAEEIVESLYNRGFILCVITNGLAKLQRPRILNSNIGRFISNIIVSEEAGADKPNPLIFNAMLKTLCLDSMNVIMIGDSLEKDIKGAQNANIKTIWYNPQNIKNKSNIYPDYEIQDLLHIKNILY